MFSKKRKPNLKVHRNRITTQFITWNVLDSNVCVSIQFTISNYYQRQCTVIVAFNRASFDNVVCVFQFIQIRINAPRGILTFTNKRILFQSIDL
jgi:hypothetical protein